MYHVHCVYIVYEHNIAFDHRDSLPRILPP